VVALTALALGGAGVAAYVVESDRVDRRAAEDLDQEISEFNQLRSSGFDPRTGERFSSVRRLMQIALERNVPDDAEVLIAWFDGAPQMVSAGPTARSVSRDSAFQDTIRPYAEGGGGVFETTTTAGLASVAVQPVQDEGGQGAWVVVFLSERERAEFRSVLATYWVLALLALAAVSLGAWSVSGRLLQPLRALTATAKEASGTDLSTRIPVEGDDDVSELVRTVNAMLDRLERAFATQRTFLDDAGHELRTPVTILRGHLELLDPDDPADVAATRELLLDEIDRMSRMVDDLIVLAKAGRPDFIRISAVDAGTLTEQVLGKMAATAARDWQVDARAEGSVLVDPQRITQALTQLISNAVRHTRPGDVVAVGSDRRPGLVRWWVRDTGTGIAEDEQEAIFERFHQGTGAAGRGDGSGLGLSIVQAIAGSHGGRVEVRSSPGQGATFVLTVPNGERDLGIVGSDLRAVATLTAGEAP
jgi:signal transduction histidine kinase